MHLLKVISALYVYYTGYMLLCKHARIWHHLLIFHPQFGQMSCSTYACALLTISRVDNIATVSLSHVATYVG